MNKNKKLIALVCALTMIFSVFAGFTVVNAETTRGIVFTNVVSSNEGKTVTADIEYVGYPNGISAATVAFAVPAGVTVKATATSTFAAGTDSNTVDGVFTLKYGAGGNLGKGETKLAALTFTMEEALK